MSEDPNVLEQQQSLQKPDDDKGKPEEEKEPEVVEGHGKVKLIAHQAFHEEREKRKAAAKERDELKQQLADLGAQVRAVEPYIQVLAKHPDLVDALQKDPGLVERIKPSKDADKQPEDEDARALAEDLGFFTESGELDVKRGQKVLARLEARAQKITDKRIKEEVDPLRDDTLTERGQTLRARAYAATDPETGRKIASKESIDRAYSLLGDHPQLTSNPQVAQLMVLVAAGLDAVKRGGSGGNDDVNFTESPGGRGGRRPSAPTALEIAAANARGKTPEQLMKGTDESEVLE